MRPGQTNGLAIELGATDHDAQLTLTGESEPVRIGLLCIDESALIVVGWSHTRFRLTIR